MLAKVLGVDGDLLADRCRVAAQERVVVAAGANPGETACAQSRCSPGKPELPQAVSRRRTTRRFCEMGLKAGRRATDLVRSFVRHVSKLHELRPPHALLVGQSEPDVPP